MSISAFDLSVQAQQKSELKPGVSVVQLATRRARMPMVALACKLYSLLCYVIFSWQEPNCPIIGWKNSIVLVMSTCQEWVEVSLWYLL